MVNANKAYSLGLPIFLVVSLLAFGIVLGGMSGDIVFDSIDVITVASVFLFIAITLFSSQSDKNLSLALPFVFIALPTAINNIFPGVYLENSKSEVIYPIICHTELYLLLSLVCKKGISKVVKSNFLCYILIWSFLFSIIVNLIVCNNSQHALLLIAGMYPIRILILTIVLLQSRRLYIDKFIIGICFSILFLALESTIFTIRGGLPTWTSGSLGGNTFGNVMGQMTCLLFFYLVLVKNSKNHRLLFLVSIFVGLTVTILTGTRMALLAVLLVLTFFIWPRLSVRLRCFVIVLISLLLVYIIKSDFVSGLSGKMDINAAKDAIDFSTSSGLEIRYSEATTSLMTRLKLWTVSTDMFLDRPLTGIGWNLFNVLKYKYGFDVNVIIDPHNGYFSFISQLGIWGFLWIYYVFYRCWKIFFKTNDAHLKTLAAFNIGMSICELTNAGSYKYGVLSMLILVSVYLNTPRTVYLMLSKKNV